MRITVGTREQTRRLLAALEEIWLEQLIVFDMDGVLVDVTDSYRETILRTVEHFTGAAITHPQIQDYKNQGGWNDDWKLSHHVIREHGVNVEFQTVVDYFQKLFHGNGTDGLILRERWIAREGCSNGSQSASISPFSPGACAGKPNSRCGRFAPSLQFDADHRHGRCDRAKPAPEGLLKIAAAAAGRKIWYVGDTVDDARCARAAGVPFIGIASPQDPRREELVAVAPSRESGRRDLDDINQLESVLG